MEKLGSAGHPHAVMIRLNSPTSGILSAFAHPMGGQVVLAVDCYLYGPAAADTVAQAEPRWQAWMQTHFPTNGAPPNVC